MNRPLLAIAAALALPALASAKESRRIGSFEIGALTYRPNIDEGLASTPYSLVFGNDRGWGFRAGVSRALFTTEFGALEVGFRTGYFQDTAKAFVRGTTVRSDDDTSFRFVPTSATLTYRFDYLPRRFNVPLTFYGRAAFERYNWWTAGTRGEWDEKGATNGWSATGGAAILLDFFDSGLARELDADTGVNDTYLYFDVTKTFVDDFGSSKSWDMSDEDLSLSAGLMFVF